MNITELVKQVVAGDQRIYTVSDCFELLTEIRDELRKLTARTEPMPQGMDARPQPGLPAEISPRLDPRCLENRSFNLSDPGASEGIVPPRVTLESAVAQYLEQKRHEVSPQHLEISRLTLEGFERYRSEPGCTLTVQGITRGDVVAYRAALLDWGRTVQTANNHMAILGAFFNWCVQVGLCGGNPAVSLRLKDRTKASRKRKAFTSEQITHVFGGLGEGGGAKYWLPTIMLYTGARPEEVAQLRVGDIRDLGRCRDLEPGYKAQWVFDFATMDDGQRRKSEASRRLVPVHPRLWDLGLGTLLRKTATEIREQDSNRQLFPELQPGANGRLAEAPSRWFNQAWLRKVKGIEDRKLVLYSLRHSVATHLKYQGVEESLIAQLLGHTNSSMTTGRYGKEYRHEHLAVAVKMLEWGV